MTSTGTGRSAGPSDVTEPTQQAARRCLVCANPTRLGLLSPPGRYFSCVECGKPFERVTAKDMGGRMLDRLLTEVREPKA